MKAKDDSVILSLRKLVFILFLVWRKLRWGERRRKRSRPVNYLSQKQRIYFFLGIMWTSSSTLKRLNQRSDQKHQFPFSLRLSDLSILSRYLQNLQSRKRTIFRKTIPLLESISTDLTISKTSESTKRKKQIYFPIKIYFFRNNFLKFRFFTVSVSSRRGPEKW